jgi:hypothetical protein
MVVEAQKMQEWRKILQEKKEELDFPADAKVDMISYDDFTNHNTWRDKGKIFDYPPHKF